MIFFILAWKRTIADEATARRFAETCLGDLRNQEKQPPNQEFKPTPKPQIVRSALDAPRWKYWLGWASWCQLGGHCAKAAADFATLLGSKGLEHII